MWKDPIVEELRAVRRQLSKEAGNDLHEICRRLEEWERQHPERMVANTIAPSARKHAAPAKRAAAKK